MPQFPPSLPSTLMDADQDTNPDAKLDAQAASVNQGTQDEAAFDLKEEEDRLMDYAKAKIILKRTIDDWKTNLSRAVTNRKKRDVEVNVEQLRQSGQLDEDETLVPVRVIDTNIQREQPAYVNYLKNSRRLTTFRSLDDPSLDTQNLELSYTQGMTYLNWETAHYKAVDGSSTHGWDTIEVVYDENYPLNCGIEHIGFDMLFFPLSNKDLQQCPCLIRAYDITIPQIRTWVSKFGFDATQVKIITDKSKDTSKANETIRIYKRYCKWNGVVYVSWFELDSSTSDWLKKPMPLDLDIIDTKTGQPKPVTQYPIFFLPYRETEKSRLIDHKGRVFLDENKQEAQTAILSGFINMLTRASNVYAAKAGEDGTGSSLKQIANLKLVGNRVLSQAVTFFTPPAPEPLTLNALQYFDDANSQETNQVNFAALNREDSRKTAKEIGAAQQQQSLLNSVQLTLFSTFIRGVYSFAWQIVQSQALKDKIKFLQIQQQQPVMNPMIPNKSLPDPSNPGMPMTQAIWVNDKKTIAQTFDIRAAGDVDVIQRQEKIQQMKQDWPVISQTALAPVFLAELIKLEYPDVGEKWAAVLMEQQVNTTNLLQSIGGILAGVLKEHPEVVATLQPQEQNTIQQVLQQTQTAVQNGMQQQQAAGVKK